MLLSKYKPVTSILKMAKSVGGRGLKAGYETFVIRVPLDLKPMIADMVDKFHNGDENLESNNSNRSLNLLVAKLEEYKSKSKPKPNRDWGKANELIEELEEILKSMGE